ncbi:TIGR03085 family protein [Paractinoplanes rishiriensis]|uniref:TIGR03085 family protein n=1 Tax=Paractinoplanes rishiriensis TaxID=1050105 RepID=A0A919MVZ1_9ACTN|nr:TIGR03085 family protein [Actinoplanes rishiriensis]
MIVHTDDNVSTITFVTTYAKNERRLLSDLLLERGPDEPTLCTGWTTRDLAAHLVVRDRRPDASAGLLVPPLREYGERVRRATAARPYPEIVAEVRNPPWWSPVSNPLLDELTNAVEFFIHHEDVRRGRPGWEPRTLDPGQEHAIWRGTQFTGRIALRRLGLPVTVVADGQGTLVSGDHPQLTLSGPAGELALFLSGRQANARVTIDGPAEAADRLRTARLGL